MKKYLKEKENRNYHFQSFTMPKGKKYKRKRSYKRGPYKKRKYADLPKEVKFSDILSVNAFQAPLTAGTIYATTIMAIPEGSQPFTRIGRKIHITGIGMRALIQIPLGTDATKGSDEIRIIYYLDKQTNGLAANIDDIFNEVGASGASSILAYRNLLHVNRFRILHDKVYHVQSKSGSNPGGTSQHSNATVHIKDWMNVDFNVLFGGATADIANLTENNVGILLYSMNEAASVSIHSRVRYLDL